MSGAALVMGGCGRSPAKPPVQKLEREDMVVVVHTLKAARAAVAPEVAATKAAWPLIVNGLPAGRSPSRPAIRTAAERAAQLKVPTLFQEGQSASITGPGSNLATLFRSYATLAQRGWELLGGAIAQIEHGSPTAAAFARKNVNLYIESIYDAHFTLAQIGKVLLQGYKTLGEEPGFDSSLTQAEVDEVAATYSEPNDRLYPHAGVKLGS